MKGISHAFPVEKARLAHQFKVKIEGIEIKAFFVYDSLKACVCQAKAQTRTLATR